MVVGILSDTHLSRPGHELDAILCGPLAHAEMIIHAGDHVSELIAEHLEYGGRPYLGVAGNVDPPSLARRLGEKRLVELGGLTVGIIHGWGPPEGLERRVVSAFGVEPGVIVFGHSHMPLVKSIGNTLLVNPGSPFTPRGSARGTVAILRIDEGKASAEIVEV